MRGFTDADCNCDGNAHSNGHANSDISGNSDSNGDSDCDANTDAYGYVHADAYSDANRSETLANAAAASNNTAAASVVGSGKWNSSCGNSRVTLASSPPEVDWLLLIFALSVEAAVPAATIWISAGDTPAATGVTLDRSRRFLPVIAVCLVSYAMNA